MSMLAEPKIKFKVGLNPRGTLWTNDENKFGQKLLEKMGWSKGKGLGKEEQGCQEPIRVSANSEKKGVGFTGNSEDYSDHYQNFEDVLANLNSENNTEEQNISASENILKNVESLEEKSKNLKSRVHYKKFTKSKDLSRYNEDDLACVLGSKRVKKDKNEGTPQAQKASALEETETQIGKMYQSHGMTTIFGGNLKDYFNQKMTELKRKREEGLLGDGAVQTPNQAKRLRLDSVPGTPLRDLEFEPERTEFSFNISTQEPEPEEEIECQIASPELKTKKKKKKKLKENDLEDAEMLEANKKLKKKKKKDKKEKCEESDKENQILQEEMGNKGKKINEDMNGIVEGKPNGNEKGIKKNKNKHNVEDECVVQEHQDIEESSHVIEGEVTLKEKKKKKKDKKEKCEESDKENQILQEEMGNKGKKINEDMNRIVEGKPNGNEEGIKKKKYKHNVEDECVVQEHQDIEESSHVIEGEVTLKEKKKKKKDKKEKCEESDKENQILQEEMGNKGKKINKDMNGIVEGEPNGNEEGIKKKKKKNKHNVEDECVVQEHQDIEESSHVIEGEVTLNEKKKKKKDKNCKEEEKENNCENNTLMSGDQREDPLKLKKKKKKDKKMKHQEEMYNCENAETGMSVDQQPLAIEYDESEVSLEKKRKRKKDRKTDLEEEITCENNDSQMSDYKQPLCTEMNESYVKATSNEDQKKKRKEKNEDERDESESHKPLKKLKKLASEISLIDILKNASDKSGTQGNDVLVADVPTRDSEPVEEEERKPKVKLTSKRSFKEFKNDLEEKIRKRVKKRDKKDMETIEEEIKTVEKLAGDQDEMETTTSTIVKVTVPVRKFERRYRSKIKWHRLIDIDVEKLFQGSNLLSVAGYKRRYI